MRTNRLILAGLGNVGRSLLEILQTQAALLRERYGLAFAVVGAADSGGAASDPGGLDLAAILAAKRAGASVATLADVGQPGVSALDLVRTLDADVLLEATPVNLRDGQPGLDIVRAALGRGMSAVLANKGPLALAYAELAGMSDLAADEGFNHGRGVDDDHRRLFRTASTMSDVDGPADRFRVFNRWTISAFVGREASLVSSPAT